MLWEKERKFQRVKLEVPAEMRHALENFPRRAQTSNVSEGGCYIEMVQTLDPLAMVEVVLWLGDEKIRARAEVVCKHPHIGNGIRFTRMPEEDKAKLRKFLETAKNIRGLPFRR
jgi:hypothetical protein